MRKNPKTNKKPFCLHIKGMLCFCCKYLVGDKSRCKVLLVWLMCKCLFPKCCIFSNTEETVRLKEPSRSQTLVASYFGEVGVGEKSPPAFIPLGSLLSVPEWYRKPKALWHEHIYVLNLRLHQLLLCLTQMFVRVFSSITRLNWSANRNWLLLHNMKNNLQYPPDCWFLMWETLLILFHDSLLLCIWRLYESFQPCSCRWTHFDFSEF